MHSQKGRIAGNGERGSIALVTAFAIVALIGVAALAVDGGSALLTKAELQNVGDAGTLAGGRELALIYAALPRTTNNKTYQLTSDDKARILATASSFASQNKAGGVPIAVEASDLVYGTFDPATGDLTPTETGVRAVSLRARRDSALNGELPTALAKVVGVDSMAVRATSVAGLTALGSVPPGEGDIPVGISSRWFDINQCGPDSTITFFPTGSSCSGWHSYDQYPPSAATLRRILEGMEDGSYVSPETTAGATTFNFIGGTLASRFDDMQALYDSKKDASGNWSVLLPVYQDSTCDNPNSPRLIVGFAKATVFEVVSAPSKSIKANVDCGVVDVGTGGGPKDYGTIFGRPLMIQ